MFSRDEMQRAIEDALKTMEGIALELYRRGREEAREELEEARARNADMRAMLEQVTRERDKARADLARSVAAWESAGMQGRTAHDAMLALAKERDEARAEVERLRETKDYLRTWLSSEELEGLRVKAAEHPLLWEEIHHLKAEVERLREMAHDFEAMREDRDEARAERDAAIARITEVGVMVATNGNLLAKDAYRRGAEAMREACAQWFREHDESFELTVDACHDVIADMPIPEET